MSEAALEKDSAWSSLREEYIEYAFLGALYREFWRRDLAVDVLRSHTDQSGFDVVLELGAAARHIQLKSSFAGATTRKQNINLKLGEKLGGCVVWILFERATLDLAGFLWFGASDPGSPMPPLGTRPVRHAKGNAQGIKAVRPNQRALSWGDFERIEKIEELSVRLFPRETYKIRETLPA